MEINLSLPSFNKASKTTNSKILSEIITSNVMNPAQKRRLPSFCF